MKTTINEGILATVFALSGTIIFVFKDNLKSKLSWLTAYSPNMVLFICFAKVIGALGLILPVQLNVLPILTPVAALGLATIMVLAMRYHILKNKYKDIPATIIFLALTLFVAYNRL